MANFRKRTVKTDFNFSNAAGFNARKKYLWPRDAMKNRKSLPMHAKSRKINLPRKPPPPAPVNNEAIVKEEPPAASRPSKLIIDPRYSNTRKWKL